MDKNYYDILEVSKKASPEVIKKAYSTLAKKYHPDTKKEDEKAEAEIKFKEINEAYEILSDKEKRATYDLTLDNNTITREQYSKLYDENELLKQELYKLKQQIYNSSLSNQQNYINNQQQLNNFNYEIEQAKQKAYHDAYIQDLKNRGYKIKYEKTFSEKMKDILAVALTGLILYILYKIPFIRDFFSQLF